MADQREDYLCIVVRMLAEEVPTEMMLIPSHDDLQNGAACLDSVRVEYFKTADPQSL